MESNQELSSDVIFEIMSRASLQTLGNCRLLSKECNSMTYESAFMNLHNQRTRTISGYFVQSMSNNKYSSTFVSINNAGSDLMKLEDLFRGPVKIEASTSQGVLLCVDKETNHRIPKYYICKPSAKQWRAIPNPKTRYLTVGNAMLVLRLNPLRFKIVRFSNAKYVVSVDRECCRLRCEIFDSEIWVWKQLEDIRLPYNEMLIASTPGVPVHGMIHWITSENNIFSYDVNEETWTVFAMPEQTNPRSNKQLVEYQGRLALICMVKEDFMDLWVVEDYENKVWKKRQSIETKVLRSELRSFHPASFYNADIALMKGIFKLMFYKFKTGSFDAVKLENHMYPEGVFPIRSDLEPCDLMSGLERERRPDRRKKFKRRNPLTSLQGLKFNFSPTLMFSIFLLLLLVFMEYD
ncbi:hypothetical protein HS088_TW13G00610 [Tripterygium wilfordii]|uniref:F-box associated beta-propeller type 3 domain-containing protein n=1 Tax=Tripterygium wilfordii TaxID=458696 RepID=A0A7J7CUH5_TRIWF|nr:F-box protein At5g49610-like [Tripterygium wilfordii]KAF5737721.1 hypothetical protein HS088_TW13G00610 [Tripterygium wilfordii]